jgi:deazaflavin-dependent oxidoreductase (nitroreductase family)
MGSVIKRLTKVVNPVLGKIAASGVIPVWGIVVHTGRKSGRRFATPIALAKTSDGFVIPLPWGPGTDWCRNLVAAGGGIVRQGGFDHVVRDPEVVDRAVAAPAFPGLIRPLIPIVGIERFLRVRRVSSAGTL